MSGRESFTVRATGNAAQVLALLAGAIILAMMLGTVADVARRYLLNMPIEGVYDLTQLAMPLVIFFGFAHCGFQGGHVAIELVAERLPPGAQRALLAVANLGGAALFAAIAWTTVAEASLAQLLNERSNLLSVPLYPFMWATAAGAAVFAWVMLLQAIRPGEFPQRPSPEHADDAP